MATILASAICSEGIINLQQDVTPWTPVVALDCVISAHITTAEIAQFTTISANGNTHVGNLIMQAMEKVVEDDRTIEDEIEITEGIHFDMVSSVPISLWMSRARKLSLKSC